MFYLELSQHASVTSLPDIRQNRRLIRLCFHPAELGGVEFLVKLKVLIGESSNKVTSDTDLVNMKLRWSEETHFKFRVRGESACTDTHVAVVLICECKNTFLHRKAMFTQALFKLNVLIWHHINTQRRGSHHSGNIHGKRSFMSLSSTTRCSPCQCLRLNRY